MTTRECSHDHVGFYNGLARCAACQMWLPSGLCSKCRKPLDDHFGALACDAGKGP